MKWAPSDTARRPRSEPEVRHINTGNNRFEAGTLSSNQSWTVTSKPKVLHSQQETCWWFNPFLAKLNLCKVLRTLQSFACTGTRTHNVLFNYKTIPATRSQCRQPPLTYRLFLVYKNATMSKYQHTDTCLTLIHKIDYEMGTFRHR